MDFNSCAEMQRGMYYVPENQDLVRTIDYFSAQIGQNNQLLLANIQQMIEKSERANRKKRKSKIGEQLCTSTEGFTFVFRTFDDGSNESIPFVHNLTGNPEFYVVRYIGIFNTEAMWGIYFRQQNIWIFQRRKNVSGNTLYTNFIKAGARFNSSLSETQIKKLLFITLVAELEATENVIEIPALAGWYKGKFKSAETMGKMLKGDIPVLPIMNKTFVRIQADDTTWDEYFYLMQSLPHWQDRIVIMLYPVIAILSSILKENDFQLTMSLNFVLLEDFPIKHVLSWFQVFNRDKLSFMDDSISNSSLAQESLLLQDEVLIFDLREQEGDTYYQKTSRLRKYEKLVRYKEQGKLVSGLVGVSNNMIFDNNTLNLCIDDQYAKVFSSEEAMKGEKAIEVFFSCFVNFVESEMDTVINRLRINRRYGVAGLFMAVFQVVRTFWEKEGIDFLEMAELPENIDFDDILKRDNVEMDELTELLCYSVRKMARNIAFIKKNGIDRKVGILYDSEHLWISTDIMNKALSQQGLMKYKNKLLLHLKNSGVLETDGHGLSRRVQHAGAMREYYKIQRGFFNREGLVDIIHLSKEGE